MAAGAGVGALPAVSLGPVASARPAVNAPRRGLCQEERQTGFRERETGSGDGVLKSPSRLRLPFAESLNCQVGCARRAPDLIPPHPAVPS